jgi:hypothetical protein
VSLYCALVLRQRYASVGVIFVHLRTSFRGGRQAASVALLPRPSFRLRLVLSLGQGVPHCAAFPATARGCGPPSAYAAAGMDVGFHDGTRCGTALPATGTGAVDLKTEPSHGPDGCDFVTRAGRTTT